MARFVPRGDLSANRIRSFEECPKRFRLSRVSKNAPRLPSSRHKRIGSLVHEALRIEGRGRAESWNGYKKPDDTVTAEDLTRHLAAAAQKTDESSRVTEIEDAREILKDSAVNISFAGVTHVELPFEFMATNVGPKVVGVFDFVGLVGADKTQPSEVLIRDYKSGYNFEQTSDFEDNNQANIYAVAAKALWPSAKKITVQFQWIELEAGLQTVTWSQELDEAVRIRCRDIYLRIKNGKDERGTPSRWACGECPFVETCEEYTSWRDAKVLELNSAITDDELLARRERHATLAEAEDAQRKACDAAIKARLKKGKLAGTEYTARLVSKTVGYVEPGLTETVDVLADTASFDRVQALDRIAAVDKKALKALLAGLPEAVKASVESELRLRRRPVSGTSYIEVRKSRNFKA